MSSLVYIANSGKKSIPADKRRDLARMAGVNFIKLVHKERCNTSRGVFGFQAVTIRTFDRAGGRQIVAEWSKTVDDHGNTVDCSRGELLFYPNEFEQGLAFLPDSPFNRRKLAAAFENGLWTIADDRVVLEMRDMINKYADEEKRLKAMRARSSSETAVASDVISENKKLKDQLEHYKNLYMKAPIEQPKPFTPLEPITNMPDTIGTVSDSITVSDDQKIMDDEVYSRAKEVAKRQVYSEYSELIDGIKNKRKEINGTDKGWGATEEYKTKVLPVIEKYTLKIIQDENPDVFGRITHGNNHQYSLKD